MNDPDPTGNQDPKPPSRAKYLGWGLAGVSALIFAFHKGYITHDNRVPLLFVGGAIGAAIGGWVTRERPDDPKWVGRQQRRKDGERESVADVARRQAERSLHSDKRLDDPLGPMEHRAMLRSAFHASLRHMAPSVALLLLTAVTANQVPRPGNIAASMVLVAIVWVMTLGLVAGRERARRFLRGDDAEYWQKQREPRGEDDRRPDAIWYERRDRRSAEKHARPIHVYVFSAILQIVAIVFGSAGIRDIYN